MVVDWETFGHFFEEGIEGVTNLGGGEFSCSGSGDGVRGNCMR